MQEPPPPSATVELRIVAFNDFHGHLEPPPFGQVLTESQAPGAARRFAAGGAAHLATAIRELRRERAHSAVVAAGDLVSASPFASSIFLDEPAVEALGLAGLELSALGNHEFDRGREEIERLQKGGCAGPGSCWDGRHEGAKFRWLAANVFDEASGRHFFPPYEIREFGGIPVAFVGAVLRGTPRIVVRSGVRGLEFRDEARSVNALVPELRRRGVEAIVLLIHEGGRLNGALADPSCPGFTGAIVDIVKRLDPAVDLVVSGHTHDIYVCRLGGRLVTSAGAFGRVVTAIDVTLDRRTRDVVASDARNVFVEPERFRPDPAVAEAVARAVARASVQADRVVGRIEGEFTALPNLHGESTLGRLVAESQLFATRGDGAQAAFMNPGGLRAPLASRRPDGAVTFGDLHSVQPFGNTLVTMTLTGAQVIRLLEQQWRRGSERPRILQVAGISYAWDGTKPVGSRIVRDSVRIGGEPLDPKMPYRIVANSFLAQGGDGFTLFTEGSNVRDGPRDVPAFEAFVAQAPRSATGMPGRILRIDPPR